MAQADSITTAVRQLMSRGRPAKFTSPARLAHIELITALAGNVPHPIYALVAAEDLEGRADHLQEVFAALNAYLSVLISDTAQNLPAGKLDGRSFENLLQDLSADAVGAIPNAAEELRDHENWRAS
jgi:hypothetical protein